MGACYPAAALSLRTDPTSGGIRVVYDPIAGTDAPVPTAKVEVAKGRCCTSR